MSGLWRVVLSLLIFLYAIPSWADESRGVIHKVGDLGEGFEDLAEHYYGKRFLAAHLRLFNRRTEPLSRGTTLIIPTYATIAVRNRQTLKQFAEAHLQDAGRAEYLAELNGLKDRERSTPRGGTKLKVVQSLKHVVRPGESLASISRLYYRDASAHRLLLLRLFNQLEDKALKSGSSLRVPLDSPEFNHAAVSLRAKRTFERIAERPIEVAVATTPPVTPVEKVPPLTKRPRPGEPPPKPVSVKDASVATLAVPDAVRASESKDAGPEALTEDAVEALDRGCSNGDFPACADGAQALLARSTDVTTRVELLRLRAIALIALGRIEESKEAFRTLLRLDPAYDLDLYRTSPKILDVFQAVAER